MWVEINSKIEICEKNCFFEQTFFTIVHPLQDQRATQSRVFLDEVVIRVARSTYYEDM